MQSIPPWKWIIAIIFDLLDFFIGWIPGFGEVFDIIGTAIAIMLWGNVGLLAAWEVFDIVGATDSPIPTVTLIGVLVAVKP